MIFAREESADSEWVLCEDHRVNGSERRVLECSQNLRTMQVVEANGSIEASCRKQAHFIADENAGDLTVMISELLKDEPADLIFASTALSRLLLTLPLLVACLHASTRRTLLVD